MLRGLVLGEHAGKGGLGRMERVCSVNGALGRHMQLSIGSSDDRLYFHRARWMCHCTNGHGTCEAHTGWQWG